jgi:hypothetical protein
MLKTANYLGKAEYLQKKPARFIQKFGFSVQKSEFFDAFRRVFGLKISMPPLPPALARRKATMGQSPPWGAGAICFLLCLRLGHTRSACL